MPKEKPFVSVCTPTFNRRPFFPYLIKTFLQQTYPQERMEWVIIDDGTDKVEDLIKDIPNVNYIKYEDKLTLGKKRNLLNEKSKGDIIVYMDDDDYYPPSRVEHAVDVLLQNPDIKVVGSSILYIYFNKLKKLYRFGPYQKNHSTAATLAFKKELLKETKFDDEAALAEEKKFLKGYSIPLIQLDSKKTILVFSHLHNTFDKNELLLNKNDLVKESKENLNKLIKDKELYEFYINNLNKEVDNYELGTILLKPDVVKQKQKMEEERKRKLNDQFIIMHIGDDKKKLSKDQVIQLLSKQHETLTNQAKIIEGKDLEIKVLKSRLKM